MMGNKTFAELWDASQAEWDRIKPIADACWAIEKQANWWTRFQDRMLWRDLREEVMQCLRDNGLHSSQI